MAKFTVSQIKDLLDIHENTLLKIFNEKFDKMEIKLLNLQEENSKLKKETSELRKLAEFLNEKYESIVQELSEIKKKPNSTSSQNDITNVVVKDKLAELEDRSRRNNLRFTGIEEDENETWELSEEKIQNVLKSKLGFKDKKTALDNYVQLKLWNDYSERILELRKQSFKEAKNLRAQGLDLKKCRGQGYDGASNMSGICSGVQTRIKEIEKNAIFIHCAAQNLNLEINDTMNGMPDISNCFSSIQEIYTFFGISINRWDILSKITGESEVTLKKLNPTRWASRLSSCIAIKQRYVDVMKALSKIILESNKKAEIAQATGLRKKMDCLDFLCILMLIIEILAPLNIVSKLLQSKNMDLDKVCSLLETGIKEIKSLRNNFDDILAKAKALAIKWNIVPTFKQSQIKKNKKAV
nr:uncharacterized protein LOC101240050 [Hydra vulgaris]